MTLSQTLPKRDESIPGTLRDWICAAPAGDRTEPERDRGRQRNRPEEPEQNACSVHAIRTLRIEGLTEEAAAKNAARSLNPALEAVRSTERKV